MSSQLLRARIISKLQSLENIRVRRPNEEGLHKPEIGDILTGSPFSYSKQYKLLEKWLSHPESYKHFLTKELEAARNAFKAYPEIIVSRLKNNHVGDFLQAEIDRHEKLIKSMSFYTRHDPKRLYAWYLSNFKFHVGRSKLAFVACHLGLVEDRYRIPYAEEGWNPQWELEGFYPNSVEYLSYISMSDEEKLSVAISRLNDGRKHNEFFVIVDPKKV